MAVGWYNNGTIVRVVAIMAAGAILGLLSYFLATQRA
jgi:hypothetical protein